LVPSFVPEHWLPPLPHKQACGRVREIRKLEELPSDRLSFSRLSFSFWPPVQAQIRTQRVYHSPKPVFLPDSAENLGFSRIFLPNPWPLNFSHFLREEQFI
jgi:hypothetical protein